MITSLIICVASAIFLILIVAGKRAELRGGRQLIRIGSDTLDYRLHSYYEKQKIFLYSVDRKYIYERLHLMAEKIEQWGLKMLDRAVNKFGRAKDMVSGKDLPKNKGAVSFFLKHIESHKKNMKKGIPKVEAQDDFNEKDVDKVALQVKMDQVAEIFDGQSK